MTTIHERINELVKFYGKGKNTTFASLIGTTEANIRGYTKNVTPKVDILERIVNNCENINPTWLLTGVGPMLLDVAPPASVSSVSNSAVAMHGTAINTVTTESSNSASRDSQELQLAKQKIEALEKLLDEKERLIKVLLDKK